MKWTCNMPKNVEEWVSKYGLLEYGATLKDFCASMGISDDTYYRWTDPNGKSYKSEFCEAIKKGLRAYKETLMLKAEKSLINLIEGAEVVNERTEYVSDASGKPIIAKKIVTKTKEAPNATAIIFALVNLKPNQWKNRQSNDIKAEIKEEKPLSAKQAQDLLKQLDDTL